METDRMAVTFKSAVSLRIAAFSVLVTDAAGWSERSGCAGHNA
jgi:hypothetical protein